MSNILSREKQVAVIRCLVEGCSVRSTERLVGVSRETVLSLLVRVGEGCVTLLDSTLRALPCETIQCDEIWAFVGKKQRHVTGEDNRQEVGDVWTFVALDADTKLVCSYLVGKRTAENTNAFVADLATRLTSTDVQISTDGLKLYEQAIEAAFGADVHYATVVKSYEAEAAGPGRYSPPKVSSVEKTIMNGTPFIEDISTSYVERQNRTMRMQIRRMTRLTDAFSKKFRNHRAATALHFAFYNFSRVHQTLRVTPAMAAGVTSTVWSVDDLVAAVLDGARP
jgi:IS1 family transposase